jgi:Reverse transcriptase (RNA-dependent DNA polymerase)
MPLSRQSWKKNYILNIHNFLDLSLKSLYGLKQAPHTFFEKLKAGLKQRQWKQHDVDPCLFYKSKKLCIVYVDDTIFAGAE